MKRHALPLLVLFLLPVGALAQPRDPADTVTGVERASPGVQVAGLNPSKLKDYLAAVQALDATLEFETSGATRDELKVDSFTLHSTWRQPAPGQPARLMTMEITPKPGQRLAGKVNKVTVNEQGKMHVDIKGMPDVTISKMTRDRNGNLVLHTDEWLIPDIHVRASDGVAYINIGPFKKEVGNLGMLLKMEHWPPTLEDLAKLAESGGAGAGPPLTGTVRYQLRGTADATGLPLPASLGRVTGNASLNTSGAIRLGADGSVTQLGDANVALELRVGTRGANLNGANVGQANGRVSYNGRYKLTIPGGDMNRTRLVADGDVSFALNGQDLVMNIPSGARVMAGGADLSGGGRLRADIVGGAGSFTLADGTYRLRLGGPVGVEGLAIPGLVAENLRGSGELTSNGNFSLEGDRVAARGDLKGRLVAEDGPDSTGVLRALGQDSGGVNASARVRAGSSVDVNLSSVEIGGRPSDQPNALPNLGDARATGTISADVKLDEVAIDDPRLSTSGGRANVRVTAELDGNVSRDGTRMERDGSVRARADIDADLAGVRAALPDGSLSASRLHVEGGGDVLLGDDGVTLTDGRAKVRLDGNGELDMGLPGGPVGARRPAQPAGRVTRATVGNLSAGSQLNLRSAPSTSSQVLAKLSAGTSLEVIGRQGSWSQVQLRDGRRGYVHNDYLTGLTSVNTPAVPATAPATLPAGRVSTTLAAGSEADLELDRVNVSRDGAVSASGRIVAARVVLGATDLRMGQLEAKVLGSATAALTNVRFEATRDGVRLPQKVSVPVRVELAAGSKVKLNLPGKETEVTLDKAGSYAEFTAQVVSDAQGQMSVSELTQVDLKLVTTAAARLMGDMATVRGEKALEFKGRVVMVGGGFDLYGSLAVRVTGDDRTPILSVRP